jgi:pimeloyl-ACP methyl ester carboxylesterase
MDRFSLLADEEHDDIRFGAWRMGRCMALWSHVAKYLRARQPRLVAPTLTGLGERSYLLNSKIALETHIHNVVNLTKWQDLLDVVLVGHSYGGSTATCHATPECARKNSACWRSPAGIS